MTKAMDVLQLRALGGRTAARTALGYRHVPTVAELAAEGLARQLVGTAWTILPEGQARIDAAMAHNATLPGLPPDYTKERH
jgi:hypothetical protein